MDVRSIINVMTNSDFQINPSKPPTKYMDGYQSFWNEQPSSTETIIIPHKVKNPVPSIPITPRKPELNTLSRHLPIFNFQLCYGISLAPSLTNSRSMLSPFSIRNINMCIAVRHPLSLLFFQCYQFHPLQPFALQCTSSLISSTNLVDVF